MAADSLVARHRDMPGGGWAWRSSIQAPHYQTDRDVGAASIGEGLLAAYAVTGDARYRRAAVSAGDFLLGVAEPAAGGLRWPDWADPNGERSATHFTSFDDGAAGISDYLWRLFRATRRAALPGGRAGGHALAGRAGRRRVMPASRRARGGGRTIRPGASATTASAWARRASSSRSTRSPTAPAIRPSAPTRVPAPRGFGSSPRMARARCRAAREDAAPETGFLSGSAGAAYMFLERYARDRDPADLATARGLLRWVNDQAVADASGGLSLADQCAAARRCRRDSSWGLPASRGSTCGPTTRPATASTATSPAARPSGCGPSRSPDRHGPSCPATPPFRSMSGSTAGRPESAGCWRTSLARASTRPRTGPPLGRRSRVCAPTRAATATGRSGTPTGPEAALGCAPSPRGTGARPGIAAFAARLAGWSGSGPGGQRRLTRRRLLARPVSGIIATEVCPQPEDAHGFDEPFRPLRPASGPKLIAALVLGPILWVVALMRRLLAARPHGRDRARAAGHRCVVRLRGGRAEPAAARAAPRGAPVCRPRLTCCSHSSRSTP